MYNIDFANNIYSISYRNYSLKIFDNDSLPDFHKVLFRVNSNTSCHPKHNKRGYFAITARDLGDYHPDIRLLAINPGLTYAEIGPGLGEFLIHASKKANVVAIDPADYNLMKDILNFSLTLNLKDVYKNLINKMLARCNFYLSINLYNVNVEDVSTRFPELAHSIDVVVENFGPGYYFGRENISYHEKMLLKEGGILLQR
ncbi:hypothetical protein D6777_01080 [Candidatus Woesearchaeota archaeon]|nr:MAG: hypothetical protein D6777_01080 [Candidatus Woesearchaeota archaeon]